MKINEAITIIQQNSQNLGRKDIKSLTQTDKKILNTINNGKTIAEKDQQAVINFAEKLNSKKFSKYETPDHQIYKESTVVDKLIKKTKQVLGSRISSEVLFRKTATVSKGEMYVGKIKEGKRTGLGTLTLPNGRKYVGNFEDGKMNGLGTLTMPDGRKYVGDFKNDKANGQGTYTWPDGHKYEGGFRNGEMHGQGTYTWPSGKTFVGEYSHGMQLTQSGIYTDPK